MCGSILLNIVDEKYSLAVFSAVHVVALFLLPENVTDKINLYY